MCQLFGYISQKNSNAAVSAILFLLGLFFCFVWVFFNNKQDKAKQETCMPTFSQEVTITNSLNLQHA